MRLSFFTLFVSFLSLTVSVATNPGFLTRHDRKRSPVPSSRQYRVPRGLVDLCINVNANLFADVGSLFHLAPLDLLSNVHLCLCLKDLDIFLATNSEIEAAVHALGPTVVGSRIRALINTSPHARQCTFPQHAHHVCNTQDPCHWACDENYVHDGHKCICVPPFVSCNGICGLFPKGCSSAVPKSLNVRSQPITLSQAKGYCKLHETVCGVAGYKDSFAFECIDTASAKDSCGGCVSPHPFHEMNSVRGVSGQDCTKIPNVRNVGCSHSYCIVTSCQKGWIPNANSTGCIVELAQASARVFKRSDPLSIKATANTAIDSEILTKLVGIVNAVLHLGPPLQSSENVTTTILYGVSLLNDINTATANLISSRTIRAFLQNIDRLIDTCSLLKTWLSSCACVQRLGLSELAEETNSLVVAIDELRAFCLNHPVISGPESPSVTSLSPSATIFPDHSLVIRPSDLLARLRLNGDIDLAIHGLGNANNLLNVLSFGFDGHHTSELLNKIAALVHLVIDLQKDLSALPLIGQPSPVDVNLPHSLARVTKYLLNATAISEVMISLEHLVALSNASVDTLETCGCINSLDLQGLHRSLKHIHSVASEALTLCHSHPVALGSNTPPSSNTTSGDVPVAIGLSNLLNRLTLDLLGPVKRSVGGLGGGSSKTADGSLDTPRSVVNPDLLRYLEALVNLVAKLQVSISLALSTNQPCVRPADLALVKEMVDALTSITPSITTPAMLITVNRILIAESSVEKALQTCSNADTVKDLAKLLDGISKVTLWLAKLCGSSKPAVIRHSTASLPPTTSRSLRIVTSAYPPSHTPTPMSATVRHTTRSPCSSATRRPTESRASPPAASTRPALSDDQIIVALNHLLSTLGSGGIKGVVTIGGLGHELNEPINELLDGLQIGPHDLRRKRADITLQVDVDALVDLSIALVNECSMLRCVNLGTPERGFQDATLQRVVGVLAATDWSKFVRGIDDLTKASVDALKLLDNCECVTERKLEQVYIYMVKIVGASFSLQRLYGQIHMGGTRFGDDKGQPIVVGLARLSMALGIGTEMNGPDLS